MIYYSFIISGSFSQIIEINRMILFRSIFRYYTVTSTMLSSKTRKQRSPMKNVRLITLVNTPTQALAAVFKLPCKFSIL